MRGDVGRNGVRGRSGSTTLATYAYNGLDQRIRKVDQTKSPNVTTDYYYNEAWQVLEEQRTVSGSTASYAQYVWDPRYIDAPVCRFRDADGSPDDGLEEVLYYTQDANCNVTALVNTSGGVVERYTYDAYGKVTFRQNDWSLQTVEGSPAGAASACDNQILYAGYRFDPESGLYHVRNRPYHPTLGAWPVRDPAGYVDGSNIYEYVVDRPVTGMDPSGLEAKPGEAKPGDSCMPPSNAADNDYYDHAVELEKTIPTETPAHEKAFEGVLEGMDTVKLINEVGELATAAAKGTVEEGQGSELEKTLAKSLTEYIYEKSKSKSDGQELLDNLKKSLTAAGGYHLWWKVEYLSCECSGHGPWKAYYFVRHHKAILITRDGDPDASDPTIGNVFGGVGVGARADRQGGIGGQEARRIASPVRCSKCTNRLMRRRSPMVGMRAVYTS